MPTPTYQALSGFIIALEGAANVGKTTQALLLREWLRQQKYEVAGYEFPDYSADAAGKLMRQMITDGSYQKCEPHQYALLAAANTYGRLPSIRRDLAAGRVVVADRYTASNIAYAAALGCDARWAVELQQQMPPADLTVWVDGAAHAPARGTHIVMETDRRLQDVVSGVYERMCLESGTVGGRRLPGEWGLGWGQGQPRRTKFRKEFFPQFRTRGAAADRNDGGVGSGDSRWLRIRPAPTATVGDVHRQITQALGRHLPPAPRAGP